MKARAANVCCCITAILQRSWNHKLLMLRSNSLIVCSILINTPPKNNIIIGCCSAKIKVPEDKGSAWGVKIWRLERTCGRLNKRAWTKGKFYWLKKDSVFHHREVVWKAVVINWTRSDVAFSRHLLTFWPLPDLVTTERGADSIFDSKSDSEVDRSEFN